MRHIIPKLSSANAYLLFSEPTITSVYLYVLQDSQKGEASRDNAVYVVSNTDGAKRITVHRTGTIVADIQYPSQFHRRKSGSVSFPGRESMSFEQWMTGAGKSGVEHELTMGSEKYTWTESSRDESVVHPVRESIFSSIGVRD